MESLARKMHTRFLGLERAYGFYDVRGVEKAPGEKILGKVKTVPEDVTDALWLEHLEGHKGIGIVPINDKSECYFGAIDVDVYEGMNIPLICEIIYKKRLPLVPFRSKSGGLHLFMFTSDPVPAALIRDKLSELASLLGYGKAEIFPKQVQILADRGDIGQWINMPYQDVKNTKRYAYDRFGKALDINTFLDTSSLLALTKEQLINYKVPINEELTDGPPCLQKMLSLGFKTGTRNDCMYNIAVYLKKSIGNEFDHALEEMNRTKVDPPLSTEEMSRIIKSVKQKDYSYTCDRSPFKDHCNMALCRQRKFGIGGLIGMPQLNGLTKFDSNPPIWFVDVEGGGRLELSTEDLQSQQRFQRKCMESLNTFPPPLKPPVWQAIVQALMVNVTIIEAPANASLKGILFEYLERFCTRAQARVIDEVLTGKPYTNKGRHYFRLLDFTDFLERNRFREFKQNAVSALLKEAGGEHVEVTIKGRTVSVWSVQEFAKQNEKFDSTKFISTESF